VSHAYGPATDVPALLSALRSPDAGRAYRRLHELLHHKGRRYPAGVAAVPELIELFADPRTPNRWATYKLLTALIEPGPTPPPPGTLAALEAQRAAAWQSPPAPTDPTAAGGDPTAAPKSPSPPETPTSAGPKPPRFPTASDTGPPRIRTPGDAESPEGRAPLEPEPPGDGRSWGEHAHDAGAAGIAIYVEALTAATPGLRLAAAHLLALYPEARPMASPALATRLTAETNDWVIASLCVAAGRAGDPHDPALMDALDRWRDSPRYLLRLSALIALAQLRPNPDDALIEELCDVLIADDDARIDNWPLHGTPAAGAWVALAGLNPATRPGLADVLLSRLRDGKPDGRYTDVARLLLSATFAQGPPAPEAPFRDLTPPQQLMIEVVRDAGLLEEDRDAPLARRFRECHLPDEQVALAAWSEL